MLLYTMLYIVLAYLMLFAALTNSVCLNNASFFFLFKYFLCQGYELSGEIALKNNHYYYYCGFIYAILHAFLQCMNTHCFLRPDLQGTVDHCQSISSMWHTYIDVENSTKVKLCNFT